MRRPPLVPVLLTAAGAIPFCVGAWAILSGVDTRIAGVPLNGGEGELLILSYGVVILAFMAGIHWGFATKATDAATANATYVLSVIPALWGFFFSTYHAFTLSTSLVGALDTLTIGFLLVFLNDLWCARKGIAPDWWITLRVPVTLVVLACLIVGAHA